MNGQSLTNLKDTPQIPDLPRTFDKAQALLELKSAIELLEKKKTDLQAETERLNSDSVDVKKRLNKEIAELKIQRKKLISQLKTLTSAVLMTKDYQKRIVKGLEEFGGDHIAFLNSLSRALQLDVRDTTADLVKKSKEITRQEEFLTELSSYLTEFARISEAETLYNAKRGMEIDKMAKDTLSARNEVSMALRMAKKELSEADTKLEQAKERYKKADLLASSLEKEFEEEKNEIDKEKKAVILAHKLVQAKEKDLERQKDRLLLERRSFISEQHRVRAIIKAWRMQKKTQIESLP